MKKRVVSLLLCGCLAVSMTAGCGSSSDEEVVTNTDAEDAAEDAAEDPADTAETEETADASEAASDMEYVLEKGTLVVGITNFEPMDYMERTASGLALTRIWRMLSRRAWASRRSLLRSSGTARSGAGQQCHRLRMERHDPDRRGDELHGVHGRISAQCPGGRSAR